MSIMSPQRLRSSRVRFPSFSLHLRMDSSCFADIQLNVKGMKNLLESFKYFVAVEMMEGENKYHAEGYGLQDAKKGFVFESFPPVLHLQLKRFEYDIHRDAMVKVRLAPNVIFTHD